MSKRSRTRQRKAERESNQKRRSVAISLVVLMFVGIVGITGFFIAQSGGFEVTDRMLLDPVRGNPDAAVTITEYAAFGCEACKAWHEAGVMESILAEFPDQVKFVYRDMPIIIPAYSQRAAEVAQCALDQGQDAFWTMHDAIYEEAALGSASLDDLVALGSRHGLDDNALRTCADNRTHRNTVIYDLQRGQELGINATPTWFVNGQRVFNASPAMLRQMIQQELARS